MNAIQHGLLLLEGSQATVISSDPSARLSPGDPALADVETLVIPEQIRGFSGIGLLPALRTVVCRSTGDVLGLEEGLSWLAGGLQNSDVLLHRLATNMLAAPPAAAGLTAIIGPGLVPVQAIPGYGALLDAIEDLAACSNGRQDSARQNICLCRSYTALKHLEYAFSMGYSTADVPYPEATARLYRPQDRLTPSQQVLYALALGLGHSCEAFYTADGPHGFHHMRTPETYLSYLRAGFVPSDTPQLQSLLKRLWSAGILGPGNRTAAVELLTAFRLTEATAFFLRLCGPSGRKSASLAEEFAL